MYIIYSIIEYFKSNEASSNS